MEARMLQCSLRMAVPLSTLLTRHRGHLGGVESVDMNSDVQLEDVRLEDGRRPSHLFPCAKIS